MKRFLIFWWIFFPVLANAQFSDNFADGDFSTNPTWTGNTANWAVVGNQLNSNGPAVTPTTLYLSTSSTLAASAQWEFFANPKLATSSGNLMDVFLLADSANLTTVQNGYFVRIGNTSDDVSLYILQNGSSSILIDGPNATIASSSNNPTKIRVTRDALGLWTLEADFTGTGTSFSLQGTATNNAITTSSFFGVKVTYSAANFNKYFFDDFNVSAIAVVDTIAPQVISATAVSSNQLDVLFNEPVDSLSAIDTLHYLLNSNASHPNVALRDASNLSLVHLSFSNPFVSGLSDSLFVDSISDLAANVMLVDTAYFTFFVPFVPGYKDLIITEIFADISPVVGLPAAEFIELYNRSNNPINLNNWSFRDNSSTLTPNIGNYLLAPDSFVVVCSSSNVALFSGLSNVLGISSFPALNDAGDNLYLRSNTTALIDSVNYLSSWYLDPSKSNGGWTLELINPDANINCAAAANWKASINTSGGTPGKVNSIYSTTADTSGPSIISILATDSTHVEICFDEAIDASQISIPGNYLINNGIGNPTAVLAYNFLTCVRLTLATPMVSQQLNSLNFFNISDCSGNVVTPITINFTYFAPIIAAPKDIIITEIYASNTATSALPNAEYVELFNRSSNPINLNNWSFKDDINSLAINIGNYILKPDSFVVLCSSTNVALFSALPNVLGISSFPSLNNSGDRLFLRSDLTTIIDSVPYLDSWYRDGVKAAGGWSLELINPSLNSNCAPIANWMASNNPIGGTPGQQNSVYSVSPDTIAPALLSVVAVDSLHITLCFNEGIDANQIQVLSNYSINGSIGNPTEAVPSAGFTCVTLTMPFNLVPQQTYTITLTGIGDCSGNLVIPSSGSFVYYTPVIAQLKQVILTEIYSSPTATSGLPNAEYVEIYNRSNLPINLAGWSLHDDVANTTSNFPQFILFPDSFLIVCNIANTALFTTNSNVLGINSFPSLNNSGDHIYLRNNQGNPVDDVNYSDSWYRSSSKKLGGWSLELIDKNFTCNNALNWIASTNSKGGTPGKFNSVNGTFSDTRAPSLLRAIVTSNSSIKLFFDEPVSYTALINPATYTFSNGMLLPPTTVFTVNDDSTEVNISLPILLEVKIIYTVTVSQAIADCSGNGVGADSTAQFGMWEEPEFNDVVINEILADPISGGTDYVEIYNRSNKIIDLSQLILSSKDTVTNELKSLSTIAIEGYLLFPGKYLLLSENSEIIKAQYFTSNPKGFWQMSNLPAFNISDGTVVLSTPQQKIIDDLHYYDSWQFPLLVSSKGVALERINYNRSTQDASNWHSASQNVGFGTPAYQNSQFTESTGGANDEVRVDPEVFSPDNDGYQDVINIIFKTDVPGYAGSITIFDQRGRLIRNLVKNELWGNSGTYSWDGITNSLDKAPIGVYVILVEVFDLNGNTRQYKKTCVVASKL